MTSNLRDVQTGLNKYCGPAFLSALTGKDTDECAKILSELSGKREIKAIEVKYLISALNRLRFNVTKENLYSYSLYGNLMNFAKKDGIYMIIVPHHVVRVEVKEGKIFLVDNHTLRPIDAAASARLMQRVEQAFKITPKSEKRYLCTELEVIDRHGYIDIKAQEVYELPEDCQELNLGYVRVRNPKEFADIIERLRQLKGAQ